MKRFLTIGVSLLLVLLMSVTLFVACDKNDDVKDKGNKPVSDSTESTANETDEPEEPEETKETEKTEETEVTTNATASVNFSWVNGYTLDKTYDGKAVEAPAASNYYAEGITDTVTTEWYAGTNKLDAAPINAGEYKVVLKAGTNVLEKTFTISKKVLTNLTFNKVYDGTKTVEIALTADNGIVEGEELVFMGMTNTADVGSKLTIMAVQYKDGAAASNYTFKNEDVAFNVIPMKIKYDATTPITKTYDGTARVTLTITEGFALAGDSCTVSFIAQTANGSAIKNASSYENVVAANVVDNNPNVEIEFENLNLKISQKKIRMYLNPNADTGAYYANVELTAAQVAKGYGYIIPEAGVCVGDEVKFKFVGNDYQSITSGPVLLFDADAKIPNSLPGGINALKIELDNTGDGANYVLEATGSNGKYSDGIDAFTGMGSYDGLVGYMFVGNSTTDVLVGIWSGQTYADPDDTSAIKLDLTDKTEASQAINNVKNDASKHRAPVTVKLKANTKYMLKVVNASNENTFDPNYNVNYHGEGIFTSWGEKIAYDNGTMTFTTLEFYDGEYYIGLYTNYGYNLIITEVVE